MNEDRFEHLMRDAAHTFRTPPEPNFDEMWQEIDERRETRDEGGQLSLTAHRSPLAGQRSSLLAIAATLVIGIALGRASMSLGTKPAAPVAENTVANNVVTEPQPYDAETSRYLGQTAALLISLPTEVRPGAPDQKLVSDAGGLLARTRLLLDSPAASDPQMRNLLEDLELVLAQVVRLQNDKNSSRIELDLISRALEQRDLIPRLRTAVADISAN